MSDINIITKDPFAIIKSAVDKTVDLIKPTYGPASNKVILSKVTHFMTVDDGVQIARDLELPDAKENAVLKVIREVAVKTNDRAGDGTTGSLIMLQAIIEQVGRMTRRDGHKIERDLKRGLVEATDQLKASAKPVKTLEDLKKVARISYDNPEVSDLIAETWHKVGVDGVVTVDRSPSMKTTAELSEGIRIDKGFISPIMVNNPERMEAVLDEAYILITDYRLTLATDVVKIMEKLSKEGKRKLLIIADNVEQDALATLIINEPHVINPHTQKPGVIHTIAINAPGSDNRLMMLEDIAMLTGGRVFSQAKGDKIEDAEITDLGQAKKVISKKDGTVIIGPKGKKAIIAKAVADLSSAIITAESQKEKEELQKRMAFFTNKVAVIKVGASTDNEQKALKYKVEDAVNAVRSAYKGGVVCGGGLALSRLNTSSTLLNNALQYPFAQLMENMGLELEKPLKDGEAINVITGKVGKFIEVGVIDPVDVLVAGIESAVSIASLLVTTSGMVVEKPQKMRQQ